ncbi:MAG: tRNA dihydrouridine synthase DusB [Saprospiraceae bacterium]
MVEIGNLKIEEYPLILAPMEDVSDPPFRILCKENGCDLMFTEFVSVEGLIRNSDKSFKKIEIHNGERPIGIQIFGAEMDSMIEAVKLINPMRPDIIDINFGCPVKKIVSKGCGAGILKDIDKMVELTKAVVDSTDIPVTVKTRLGWDEESIVIGEVVQRLEEAGIKAISIHARTRSQMYKGHSDWSYLKTLKENGQIKIPIFGNGDINSPQKAMEYRNTYKVDGLMIGRAAIGNPWIFREIKHFFKTGEIIAPPTLEEKIDAVKRHLKYSIEWKGEKTGVYEMRQHYTNYFRGIPNIKETRIKLTTTNSPEELFRILDSIIDIYE